MQRVVACFLSIAIAVIACAVTRTDDARAVDECPTQDPRVVPGTPCVKCDVARMDIPCECFEELQGCPSQLEHWEWDWCQGATLAEGGGDECAEMYGPVGFTRPCLTDYNYSHFVACILGDIACGTACGACLAGGPGCPGCIACILVAAGGETCLTHCEFIDRCYPHPDPRTVVTHCGYGYSCVTLGSCTQTIPPADPNPPNEDPGFGNG